MTHDEIMAMVRQHVQHAMDAKARIDQTDLEALSAALGDRVASVQLDLPSKMLTVRLQPAAVMVELGFAFSWRHDFVWRHVPGTLCDGRHICEHLDHWEVRCNRCGEPECTLSRESPCSGSKEHCGAEYIAREEWP